ncbi:hypothetical protein MMC06_004037 [Schaereria dolodes]|nr:hypothetical protein [Schaereria dolodes]
MVVDPTFYGRFAGKMAASVRQFQKEMEELSRELTQPREEETEGATNLLPYLGCETRTHTDRFADDSPTLFPQDADYLYKLSAKKWTYESIWGPADPC